MKEWNYDTWLTDFLDYLIPNAGGALYSSTVQARYKDVNRTTLLAWLKRAEEVRFVQKIELGIAKPSRIAYSIHPDWIRRAEYAAAACEGRI